MMKLAAIINGEKTIFPLKEGSSIVGRADSCRIVLKIKGISRQHAQFYVDSARVTLRDLKSSNGVYVNGIKIENAILQAGDVIRLGKFEFLFETEGGMESTTVIEEEQPIKSFIEDAPPSEEDTPIDQQFAPVKYENQEALAVRPRLLQRDGKWYLKDPNSNREVEIVPKLVEDGRNEPLEQYELKKINRLARMSKLRLSILGILTIAVLALVIIAISGQFTEPKTTHPIPSYTINDYNQATHLGIKHIENGLYEEAEKVFQLADSNLRERYVAGILRQINIKIKENSNEPTKADWDGLGDLLREIKQSVFATPTTETFANRKLEWVDMQLSVRAIVSRAIRKLRKGEPESAWQDFLRIPEGHISREVASVHIETAKEQCVQKYINLARKAEASRLWDEAIVHYEKAQIFQKQKKAHSKEIEYCLTWKADAIRIQEASQALKEQRYVAIKPLLGEISEISPYREEALGMIEIINREQEKKRSEKLTTRLQSLYATGKGSQALELVRQEKLLVDQRFLETIRDVVITMETADQAYKEKEFEKAQAGWERILNLEPNQENSYHRLAKERLQDFNRIKGEIAYEYEKKAEKAMGANQYQLARQFFIKAQRFDPDGELGKRGLEHLNNLTQEWWSKGLVAFNQGKTKEARAAFKMVLGLAERGQFHYDDARKKLMVLNNKSVP